MPQPEMKKLLPIFLSFLVLGCSTEYLIGYHYLGNDEVITGVVSEKTGIISKSLEEKCIQDLMRDDVESFKKLLTDKLLEAVPKDAFIRLKNEIRSRYQPNGKSERLQVRHEHMELDTAALLNGFEHYDYIEADYLLYGATDALVHLYMTEVGGVPRLSGFALRDAVSGEQAARFSMKYLVPETVDKAGLLGREIIKLPK
jgi:hypothetical protein